MFFRKKNTEGKFSSSNLRRRFHHILIAKRKENSPQSKMDRPKRRFKQFSSATFLAKSPSFQLFKKIFIFLVIGGIFIGIIYSTVFSRIFVISKISIVKNSNAVAETAILPYLERLRGKNILFVNLDGFADEIIQTFKNEILFVKIKKSYPNEIIAQVEEYPLALNLWVFSPEKNQKFILNQIGYAVFENTENKTLPKLIVNLPKALTPKTVLIDKEKMMEITDAFRKFIEIFGIKVVEGEWMKVARELHLKTEKNFEVWLDLTAPIDRQLNKLKRALTKLDIAREPLEYIDLRIAGTDSEKVIFKRRK